MKKSYLVASFLVATLLLVGAGCQQVEQNSNTESANVNIQQSASIKDLPLLGIQIEYIDQFEEIRNQEDGNTNNISVNVDRQTYHIVSVDIDQEMLFAEGAIDQVSGDYMDLSTIESLESELAEKGVDYINVVDLSDDRYVRIQKGVYGTYSARLYGVIQDSAIEDNEYITVANDWFVESENDDIEKEIAGYIDSDEFIQFVDFFNSIRVN